MNIQGYTEATLEQLEQALSALGDIDVSVSAIETLIVSGIAQARRTGQRHSNFKNRFIISSWLKCTRSLKMDWDHWHILFMKLIDDCQGQPLSLAALPWDNHEARTKSLGF